MPLAKLKSRVGTWAAYSHPEREANPGLSRIRRWALGAHAVVEENSAAQRAADEQNRASQTPIKPAEQLNLLALDK